MRGAYKERKPKIIEMKREIEREEREKLMKRKIKELVDRLCFTAYQLLLVIQCQIRFIRPQT